MRVVKVLPKFDIIYLHNPFKCPDCYESNQCIDDYVISEAEKNTGDKKKSKRRFKKPKTLVLLKNSTLVHRKHSTICTKVSRKCALKKQSKTASKITKPSKKIGKLKTRNRENVSCVMSVIKARRNKEKSKKKRIFKGKNSHAEMQRNKPKTVKQDDEKPPGKGTLKRKRWFLEKLNSSNENYEDDIFENENFYHFHDLIEDETDNIEIYENIKTPQLPFSISPREESPSPVYRDCYSPTELTESRKGAEEYRFRRGKMRKGSNLKRNDTNFKSENKPDVKKTLEAVVEILNKTQKILDGPESDDEEDSYFPDLFNQTSSHSSS